MYHPLRIVFKNLALMDFAKLSLGSELLKMELVSNFIMEDVAGI
jgi:hypothetical protein